MTEEHKSSRNSLREFFTSSSSSSLNREQNNSTNSVSTNDESPGSSHRFFLREKSRNTLSPQTSSTSVTSLFKKNQKTHSYDHLSRPAPLNEGSRTPSGEAFHLPPVSLNTSVHSLPKLSPHEKKVKDKKLKDDHKERKDPKKSPEKKLSGLHHHGSHLSLRRFLKKLKGAEGEEKPAGSKKHSILPHHSSSDIYKKYGSIGKLIGSGASGSVSLVTSKEDPLKIYAIKKFRAKLTNESDQDYKVKVKNEFTIGDYLNHENVIRTVELIKETSSKFMSEPEYFIVMEYCPFDFFNLVMLGLMSKEEIYCYFKQIVNGVAHMHSFGIAHRDLKLDNCVVSEQGILKLIDFGSAVQFKREKGKNVVPEEESLSETHRLVKARGIVGSDPYLAPEVFEPSNFGYDPRLVDVWSIAIIYCCMILKRFPWKIPKASDPSYKSFSELHEPSELEKLAHSLDSLNVHSDQSEDHHHHHGSHHGQHGQHGEKKHRGPERLLRLLPSESRSLVKGMLEIPTEQRYLIGDVIGHPFYASIDHCHTVKTEDENTVPENGVADKPGVSTGQVSHGVYKPKNHVHHLVTEEELTKINLEKERMKKLKDSGVV